MSCLVTVDFSQVEARGLLWLAGDEDHLAPYRRGADAYLDLAARMFGLDYEELERRKAAEGKDAVPQRKLAKVAQLALQFGGGVGALRKSWAKIRAAGFEPIEIVERWRDAYPLITGQRTGSTVTVDDEESGESFPVAVRKGGWWRELHGALKDAVSDSAGRYSVHSVPVPRTDVALSFVRDGADVLCYMPNGRPTRYRDARWAEVPDRFSDEAGATTRAVVYAHPKGTRELTRSVAVENAVQSTCRDLLAEALVRLERAGFPVVLHVHDEVVVEVDAEPGSDAAARALQDVIQIVSEVPEWAVGFPVAAEGDAGARWSK